MIKVEIAGWKFVVHNINDSEDRRPAIFSKAVCRYFFLEDRFHFWLLDNNIEYSIHYENGWYIDFDNKKDAILFKLTWC